MKYIRQDGAKIRNIGLLAALLTGHFILSLGKVFSYDEAYTAGMIMRDYRDILQITSQDVHTPFYYFTLKFFASLTGNNIYVAKLFSLLFFCLYLLGGYWICRREYSERVSFYWIVLSGFMPAMIVQSSNARMYTFSLFWVTVSGYLAYCCYREQNVKLWIAFTASAIISVYIHTFDMLSLFVVYGILLAAALVRRNRTLLKNTLISGLTVSAAYCPWLIVLYHQFRRWSGAETGWGSHIQAVSARTIAGYFAEWFSSLDMPDWKVVIFLVLLMSLLSFSALRYFVRERDFFPLAAVIVFGIVFVFAMIVSICVVPCFMGRYLFPLSGGIWLFAALGIQEIRKRAVRCLAIAGIIFCGILTYRSELALEDPGGLDFYLEVIDNCDENTVIMADTYYALMLSVYEPDRKYMIYGGKADNIPFGNVECFTEWEQLKDVDTVIYLSFKNFRSGDLTAEYLITDVQEFNYSYYNFIMEKYEKIKEVAL